MNKNIVRPIAILDGNKNEISSGKILHSHSSKWFPVHKSANY